MSDYLSRAASRADAPAAPAVRPRLQSRYGSAPAPAAEQWTAQAPGEQPAPVLLEGPLQNNEVSPATDGAGVTDRPNGAPITQLSHVTHFHTAAPVLPAAAAPLQTSSPALDNPQSSASLSPAALSPFTVHAPPDVSSTAPTAMGHPPSAMAAHVVAAASSTPPAALSPVRNVQTAAAPLLELPRTAAPPSAVTVAAAAPEHRTVNITIGRLEIRAAAPASPSPPPPTRAAAAQGRGPLGLDEFLRSKSPRHRSRP